MHCAICDRDMIRCICENADERIESLRKSPFLDASMFDVIIAERFLAKFEIEADRAKSKQPPTNG